MLQRFNIEVAACADGKAELTIDQVLDHMKAFILRIQSFSSPPPPQGNSMFVDYIVIYLYTVSYYILLADSTFTIEVHRKGESIEDQNISWVPVDELAIQGNHNQLSSCNLHLCTLIAFFLYKFPWLATFFAYAFFIYST